MIINLVLNLNILQTRRRVYLLLRMWLNIILSKLSTSNAVYTCLLDARKAFERVNHCTLFAKLVDTQATQLIARVFIFRYQIQNVCIRWGNSYSNYFAICSGVRQGGILSPRLFALYVNQLTDKLISCNAGCYINDMCIDHVMYADDIMFISL